MNTVTPQYAVSDSGTLVYLQGESAGLTTRLAWADREGKEELIGTEPNAYFFPKISPDGNKVALTVGLPGNSDIWIWDVVRKNLKRLTRNEASGVPLWTADGRQIVYGSEGGIFLRAADGTGKIEPLASVAGGVYPWSWADNGKILILEDARNNGDIGMLLLEDDRTWKPLLEEEYGERQPQVSPDGQWIAYASDHSGQFEIYVRPFPDLEGGLWEISTSGGENPLWSPDGRELFYRIGDEVMVVDIKTEPAFEPGNPKTYFRGTYFYSNNVVGTLWDIHPDGNRFLMIKPPGTEDEESTAAIARKINVILNFDEELQKRVPVN